MTQSRKSESRLFLNYLILKHKPLDPGLHQGDGYSVFRLVWEFQSFFITLPGIFILRKGRRSDSKVGDNSPGVRRNTKLLRQLLGSYVETFLFLNEGYFRSRFQTVSQSVPGVCMRLRQDSA